MTTTVLPELAKESVETAERLGSLSAQEELGAAEADYILSSGLAALQRASRLWPIIRARIGDGMTAPAAHQLLTQVLDAVDKNLSLAARFKEPACGLCASREREPEAAAGLAAAEQQLLDIQVEVIRLLKVVNAPARWPGEEQLRAAKESVAQGDRLSADQFRQALLGK